MGFWIFMFIVTLLIPVMMIVFGLIFLKNPPQEINWTYGYRTSMSMKNQETWDFAHQYVGKIWFKWGIGVAVISVVVMLLVISKDTDTVGWVGGGLAMVQILPLLGAMIPTEMALKRAFDKDGKRK